MLQYSITYKLVFCLIDLNLSDFFILRSDDRNSGHKYKLFVPSCSSSIGLTFYLPDSKDVEWLFDLPADSRLL